MHAHNAGRRAEGERMVGGQAGADERRHERVRETRRPPGARVVGQAAAGRGGLLDSPLESPFESTGRDGERRCSRAGEEDACRGREACDREAR